MSSRRLLLFCQICRATATSAEHNQKSSSDQLWDKKISTIERFDVHRFITGHLKALTNYFQHTTALLTSIHSNITDVLNIIIVIYVYILDQIDILQTPNLDKDERI